MMIDRRKSLITPKKPAENRNGLQDDTGGSEGKIARDDTRRNYRWSFEREREIGGKRRDWKMLQWTNVFEEVGL